MDGLLFFVVGVAVVSLLLFFPIFLTVNAHLDIAQKKLGFAVFFYKCLKIIGGYAESYQEGIALHVSKRKAILIPYTQMGVERKRFSFMKTFRLISIHTTTETGAEYVLPVSIAHCFIRVYFFLQGGNKDKIVNNLWLTDGDKLRISLRFTLFFNGYTIILNVIKFLKERIKAICRKKSII